MDQRSIRQFLPHREPFLFVDDILEIRYKQYAIGVRTVGEDEPWIAGHFPGNPLFPGVLLIETMAQIGSFVFYAGEPDLSGPESYLAQAEKVKFLKSVRPGQTLRCEGTFVSEFGSFAKVSCKASVGNETVCEAILTYFFNAGGGLR